MRRADELAHLSDVISIHPYFMGGEKKWFERDLDCVIEKAAAANKQVIATETGWGSYNDNERAGLIAYTLEQLNKRNIGWLAYVLNASAVTDAHAEHEGAYSRAGNLAFINSDGGMRPGHEVISLFGANRSAE